VTLEGIDSYELFSDLHWHLGKDAGGRDYLSEMEEGKNLRQNLCSQGHIKKNVLKSPKESHQSSSDLLLCDQMAFEKQLGDVCSLTRLDLLQSDLEESHQEH
jgi:hypothetical protein